MSNIDEVYDVVVASTKFFASLEEQAVQPLTVLDFRALFLAEEYWRGYLAQNGRDASNEEVRLKAVESWQAFRQRAQAIELSIVRLQQHRMGG